MWNTDFIFFPELKNKTKKLQRCQNTLDISELIKLKNKIIEQREE